jgi:tripartite-type tricarboxylate transporter receptor subunit TctC
LQAVLAGDVKVAFLTPSALLSEHVNAGKVKVIGITSSSPSTLFPGVAPISRYLPDYVQEINYALWAPGGLPVEVARPLGVALIKVLQEPDMSAKLQLNGMVKDYRDTASVMQIARREDENIRKVLATTSIRIGG